MRRERSRLYRVPNFAPVQNLVQVRPILDFLVVDRSDDVPENEAPVVVPRGGSQPLRTNQSFRVLKGFWLYA